MLTYKNHRLGLKMLFQDWINSLLNEKIGGDHHALRSILYIILCRSWVNHFELMATAFGIRCVHNIVDINRPALMREEKKYHYEHISVKFTTKWCAFSLRCSSSRLPSFWIVVRNLLPKRGRWSENENTGTQMRKL